MFDEDRYELSVTEGSILDSPLLNLNASDGDVGVNAELSYSVDISLVNVNVETGELELPAPLDYELYSTLEIEVHINTSF